MRAQGLDGNIALLDKDNKLVSTVDVAALIGHLGSLHPHDALFLPNGDVVVTCWKNPGTKGSIGTISYWQRVKGSA